MPDKYIMVGIGIALTGATYGLTRPLSKIMQPLPLAGQLLVLTLLAVSITGISYGLFILIRRIFYHG